MLWQRNPLLRVPIASLTKMMTALLTVKATTPRQPVLITKAALETSGSKVGVLPVHRHVPVESLLYGLLLPSGNDAAVALADTRRRQRRRVRARDEPAGGPARDGLHALLLAFGLLRRRATSRAPPTSRCWRTSICAQPRIARVTHTYSAVIPFPIKGGKLYLYNNNPLLIYRYSGTTGMKTGYTIAAGRCLVATAERDGVRLAAVVLNSTEPGRQAARLLDAGFQHVYHLPKVPDPQMPPGA